MTKVIITKDTVANNKFVKVGQVIDLDSGDASYLVNIKKAKYFELGFTDETQVAPQPKVSSVEPIKKKRGRPAKAEGAK